MPRTVLRLLPWIVAGVAAAGGAWLAYQRLGGDGDEPPRYTTETVARTSIVATVTATGTLSARNTVQVGSQVSGRVLELKADFNDVVKKGQVIARIDPQLFQSEVAKARANLQSAQANLTRSKAAAEDAALKRTRAESLGGQGVLAAADVETAQTDDKSARAQEIASVSSLSQARAALAQAEVNLAYTTIVSPIDGVVISRDVDVGQTVAASLQAPTLFTIAEDLRAMEVHTSVAESDVGRLREGMAVTFTVDAFPDERFRGEVRQIRNAPTTVQNVVTYDAVIGVSNDEQKLRPGMTANVTFRIDEKRDVPAVPAAALRFTPPEDVVATLPAAERELLASRVGGDRRSGGDGANRERPEGAPRARRSVRVVWVLEAGAPHPRRIQIGLSDGRYTEITDGLADGAVVITGVVGAAPAARPAQNRGGGPSGGRLF